MPDNTERWQFLPITILSPGLVSPKASARLAIVEPPVKKKVLFEPKAAEASLGA